MKNKIFSTMGVAAIIASATLVSCSEEQILTVGEGKMFLSTRVNSDVKVESRAAEDLAASTIIWISNDEGVVRKYNGMAEVPASGIKLLSDDYTVKAWAGKLEYASFESRWFEGEENVSLTAGSTQSVEVVCKIANVVTSVKYAEGLEELISDYSVTVSHKGGSLTFEGADTRKGYFMMPEGVTTLDYVFNATCDGKPVSLRGTIENVEPAHEYVLNIKTKDTEANNDGAAFITIEIDDRMDIIEDEVVITTPPSISGFGFDISAPVAGESGSMARRSVYVCAASELTSVIVSGVEGHADFDFCRATADVLAQVNALGISNEVENVDGGQMMKIVFDDVYLNKLANRDEPYVVTITATDAGKKSTTARLQLRISEAPVITNPVKAESISYLKGTLEGQVAKEGLASVGFEYRKKGSADWTYVAGQAASLAKGQTFTAALTGLDHSTTYEYRAVSGTAEEPADFRADIAEFSTLTPPQLPYADMENWGTTSDKATMPLISGGSLFWDNGNHGSQTMGKNITNPSSAFHKSGSKSAELASQFVGLGSIGKFAAGNLFVGEYLETAGTNGVIGFGREFEFPAELKVTGVRLWVKYTPQPVAETKENSDFLKKGDMDQGHIFTAIFDGYDDTDLKGEHKGQYGKIVRTKEKQLFDKDAANICAYGERIFTEATPGNDLVEVIIPLEYRAGKGAPKLITVVCTASRYGDYFSGGRGTVMYVDDVELIYEPI